MADLHHHGVTPIGSKSARYGARHLSFLWICYKYWYMKPILIGGMFESLSMLEQLSSTIEKQVEGANVTAYSFRRAMLHRAQVVSAVNGNVLLTHSAGALAVSWGVEPEKALLVSPTQPCRRRTLAWQFVHKTLMFMVLPSRRGSFKLRLFFANILEVVAGWRLYLNPKLSREISNYDLNVSLSKRASNYNVNILVSSKDELYNNSVTFFKPSQNHNTKLVIMDAYHDELFINPIKVIKIAFNL